jgi:hypothetical protein
MNQVSRIQGLFKIFRKDLENIWNIFESKWRFYDISPISQGWNRDFCILIVRNYIIDMNQVSRIQGLFKIFRKDLENICNIFESKWEILRYKSNISRMKSLFLYPNRAKLHYRYESSVKDSGIFQNIQKRLRKYLKLFLKVNGRFYDISPISQGWNRDFCILIVRNYIIDMNQVSRIQGFSKYSEKT